MAKLQLYLDKRSQKKDGTYPVKIMLSHKQKTKLEKTGVSVKVNEWDAEAGEIIGNSPLKKQINLKLKRELMQLQMALIDVEALRDTGRMTLDELMNALRESAGFEVRVKGHFFLPYYHEQAEKKNKQRTREIYAVTEKHIKNFDMKAGNLTFDDITPEWLANFEQWMKAAGYQTNNRSIQLRNIRSVMNDARKAKLTDNYPFDSFKIKHAPTAKRTLGIDEIHRLWTMEAEEEQRMFVDMFKLSLALIGINTVDMFNAKKGQIVAGRLDYKREKTGKLYSVKILPEAKELIEKYSGTGDNLLMLSERYENAHTFTIAWNKQLQKIDKRISAYWARHTWATTAAELDIPKETIAGALGHSIGMDTTSIYIRFDQRKIDKANRKVLDAVIRGEIPEEDEA